MDAERLLELGAAAGLVPRGEFSLTIAGLGVTPGLNQKLAAVRSRT